MSYVAYALQAIWGYQKLYNTSLEICYITHIIIILCNFKIIFMIKLIGLNRHKSLYRNLDEKMQAKKILSALDKKLAIIPIDTAE